MDRQSFKASCKKVFLFIFNKEGKLPDTNLDSGKFNCLESKGLKLRKRLRSNPKGTPLNLQFSLRTSPSEPLNITKELLGIIFFIVLTALLKLIPFFKRTFLLIFVSTTKYLERRKEFSGRTYKQIFSKTSKFLALTFTKPI